MDRIRKYLFAFPFAALSYFHLITTVSISPLILSGCGVTYDTINPELTKNTRHFTIYKKGATILGKSEFVINDSSGSELFIFTVSGSGNVSSKAVDWTPHFSFPETEIKLVSGREHSFEVNITNNADSKKHTLFYVIREAADGELKKTALGDTVLILDANARIGYVLSTNFFFHPGFPTGVTQRYEVELDNIRTTIKHRHESLLEIMKDWFSFYHDDEYLAAIGNAEAKSFGDITYHVYIKNNLSSEFQRDVFFFYVAVGALSDIKNEIGRLRTPKKD